MNCLKPSVIILACCGLIKPPALFGTLLNNRLSSWGVKREKKEKVKKYICLSVVMTRLTRLLNVTTKSSFRVKREVDPVG